MVADSESREPATGGDARSIAVFGGGVVSNAIREALAREGFDVSQYPLREQMSRDDLCPIFGRHSLAISAAEGLPHAIDVAMSAAALETKTPLLLVGVAGAGDNLRLWVGPTVTRESACYACAELAGELSDAALSPAADRRLLTSRGSRIDSETAAVFALQAASIILREVRAFLVPDAKPLTLTHRITIGAHGISVGPSLPLTGCPRCSAYRSVERESLWPTESRALVAVSMELDRRAVARERRSFPERPDAYKTVGIVGGGTAGYLTALTLRARRPELEVTLIESSKIPVIGVGEATTPLLTEFMHHPAALGRDRLDFYRRVLPTWKLGIRFFWGLPGRYDFQFPFEFGSVVEPMVYSGNIDAYCLGAVLQADDRTPFFDNGDGTYSSLFDEIPYAYHLDNPRFVRYLHEEAVAAGITVLDRELVDARVTPDGEAIDELFARDGSTYKFDLYIDCSGFRSLLLEGKLRSPFLSYARSLFNDSAVMANVPHGGLVKPYTLAESMDHGWCWNIPFEDSDHRGYVFSSAFATPDQAIEEMRRKNPGLENPWSLKFRSGRHADFWKGNVVALGNAYAFVEPLESTAIHMLLVELDLLVKYFPRSKQDRATPRALSAKTNALWDNLRDFLTIHFKFNRKFDTPYWRACNNDAELNGAEARVALFKERAPLVESSGLFNTADPFFHAPPATDFFAQEYVYDVLLAGQQVEASWARPRASRADWEARVRRMKALSARALPQARALALLRERPELLMGRRS